jgi:SAM-dependent methyltransferase
VADPTLLDLCRSERYITDKYYRPNGVDWNARITKGAGHSYVEQFYEKHLAFRRYTAKNVLEIGTYYGGSTILWRDYFPNATVIGADINYTSNLANQNRIVQIIGDSYLQENIDLYKDGYFDVIIDDGSHLLPHMEIFIQKYPQKLKSDGILVVEDIDNIEWANKLFSLIPDDLKNFATLYDLREVNGRYDDIAIVIDRG